MRAARAVSESINRAWFDEAQSKIAGRAGLTLDEFRAKAESVRRDIMRDPEAYRLAVRGEQK